MNGFRSEDLQEVFARLFDAQWHGIVIGGQAVNLWVNRYADRIVGLDAFRPLTSRDLDFHGGPREAQRAMSILGAEGKINDGSDPSPNAGLLKLQLAEDQTLLIDILTGVLGISSAELLRTSVRWAAFESRTEVSVIHPLLLLESKLTCLRTLGQDRRQDEKHVRLMVHVLHHWLSEQLDRPRDVFRGIERIAASMMTPVGIYANERGVELWDAIPLANMKSRSEYDAFFERRLPQLRQEIEARRSG